MWKCGCGAENTNDCTRCICGNERETLFQQKGASDKNVIQWIGIILSLGGAFYCFLGFAMIGSFSVAAPEGKAHWKLMAELYLTGMAICSLLAIFFAVSIIRKRHKKNIKQQAAL
jgi:hypothetical protein